MKQHNERNTHGHVLMDTYLQRSCTIDSACGFILQEYAVCRPLHSLQHIPSSFSGILLRVFSDEMLSTHPQQVCHGRYLCFIGPDFSCSCAAFPALGANKLLLPDERHETFRSIYFIRGYWPAQAVVSSRHVFREDASATRHRRCGKQRLLVSIPIRRREYRS